MNSQSVNNKLCVTPVNSYKLINLWDKKLFLLVFAKQKSFEKWNKILLIVVEFLKYLSNSIFLCDEDIRWFLGPKFYKFNEQQKDAFCTKRSFLNNQKELLSPTQKMALLLEWKKILFIEHDLENKKKNNEAFSFHEKNLPLLFCQF